MGICIISKIIYVVDRIAISIEFDYQCHCLVMKQSVWIVLSDNDGLFGYLINVLGVHTI